MTFRPLASCLVFAFATFAAIAQPPLNDTGIVTCYSATAATGTVSAANPDPETAGFNAQDCTRGASAADAMGQMLKIGASTVKGRDYTKIANDGSELPASASLGANPSDWACTRDNVTGLLWEIKTADAGLRGKDNRYTWYNPDDSVNGGTAGQDSNVANCNDGDTTTNCDTLDYTGLVNASNLCGASTWRLPTTRELQSLLNYAATTAPFLDTTWFPNTSASAYWTAVTYVSGGSSEAWVIYFDNGSIRSVTKSFPLALRLVAPAPRTQTARPTIVPGEVSP